MHRRAINAILEEPVWVIIFIQNIIYSKSSVVRLTDPPIPGFSSFREIPHLVPLINEIPADLRPQVMLVSGDGVLHERGFGLACHLGVLLDMPTIGVVEDLVSVDGLDTDLVMEKLASSWLGEGDTVDLLGESGAVLGKAYKSIGGHFIISVGHKISLATAKWVVDLCCVSNLPDPLRQVSRECDRLTENATLVFKRAMKVGMPCIFRKWIEEQYSLRRRLSTHDNKDISQMCEGGLNLLGGVDVSFIKGDDVNACACIVVLEFPSLKIIYKKHRLVKLKVPYVSGFLEVREGPHLAHLINELPPNVRPQVVLVDGNGTLHHRGFGLACYLGVVTGFPTIGIGKSLLAIDGLNYCNIMDQFPKPHRAGDSLDLVGRSGFVRGKAYMTCRGDPIYISPGHQISLETAKWVVDMCCPRDIPEPVRQADFESRRVIRQLKRSGCLPQPEVLPGIGSYG